VAALAFRNGGTYRHPYGYRGLVVNPTPQTSVLRTQVRSTLQGVPTNIGELVWFQSRSSGPSVQTPVFGGMQAIWAHISERRHVEQYDEHLGAWMRLESAKVRISDASPTFYQGDIMTDPLTFHRWAVVGVASSGVGTIAYALERKVPIKTGPNRGDAI
jgi:hypothetical protein